MLEQQQSELALAQRPPHEPLLFEFLGFQALLEQFPRLKVQFHPQQAVEFPLQLELGCPSSAN